MSVMEVIDTVVKDTDKATRVNTCKFVFDMTGRYGYIDSITIGYVLGRRAEVGIGANVP